MKKNVCLILGLVLMIACLSACGSGKEEAKELVSEVVETAPETTSETASEAVTEAIPENESEGESEDITEDVTYEFDTFDGQHIVVDSSNILSQNEDENPLETTKVPKEAEVIAPGRDYVLLDDGEYYYVEDTVNNLVTVVTKGMNPANAELTPGLFETDDWSITYDTEKWDGHWDKEGECIINNLNAVAGSSYIHVFEIDVETVDEAASQIEDMRGKKLTAPCAVTMKDNEGYSFWDDTDTAASGPYIFDYYLAFEHKGKVVVINESITHDDDDSRAEELSYEFDDVVNTLILK